VQFQQVDDDINVFQLLLVGDRSRLSEEGGEFECFANGRLRKMNIKLLNVYQRQAGQYNWYIAEA
jgi:hypothetical protein